MDYYPKMDWVPAEIVKEFGDIKLTVIDGECLDFEISKTDLIVDALTKLGFNCTRDDLLIAKAYGQD